MSGQQQLPLGFEVVKQEQVKQAQAVRRERPVLRSGSRLKELAGKETVDTAALSGRERKQWLASACVHWLSARYTHDRAGRRYTRHVGAMGSANVPGQNTLRHRRDGARSCGCGSEQTRYTSGIHLAGYERRGPCRRPLRSCPVREIVTGVR